jgi:hypothetical protein
MRSKNFTYIKALALLMILVLSMGLLAGCGSKPADPQPSDPGQTQQPEQPPQPAEPEKVDPKTALEDFLNDKGTVKSTIAELGLEQGMQYTFQQLAEITCDGIGNMEQQGFMGDITYSFIDCGMDGIPELALCIEYIENYGEWTMQYEQYYIIKAYDDGLRIIDSTYTAYRTYSSIYESGIITSGGSDSAASWGFSHRLLDKDGNKVFLFDEYYTSMLGECVIPSYMLPKDKIPEGYPDGFEFSENGYDLAMYSTKEIMYDSPTYEADKIDRIFVFSDIEGKDASPEEAYLDLYADMGVTLYTQDQWDAFLDTYLQTLGIPESVQNATEVDNWIKLDNDWMPKG